MDFSVQVSNFILQPTKVKLQEKGIKCLSLVFIDRVENYIKPDGVIKVAFAEQYRKVYKNLFGKEPDVQQIEKSQGYYFAQTSKGDYSDGEGGLKEQKKLYDLILKDKEELLSLDNPVEFIFSHSALGVGWDNPNVFNIATLNQSYSEIKKRQEIGRGLRICVNQNGQRIYDAANIPEGEELNLLTVIPNETYETFVSQYQSEIEEVYGTSSAGAETRNNHKGSRSSQKEIKRNKERYDSPEFREFWRRLSKKTEYLVTFDEDKIISDAIKALNDIKISEHQISVSLGRIQDITHEGILTSDFRTENKKTNTTFSPVDLVEEISENTSLAYPTVFKIVCGLKNRTEIIKNPPRFMQEAIRIIKTIELDEMLRALDYRQTGESYNIGELEEIIIRNTERIQATPNKGIYDKIVWDSEHEQAFAQKADTDPEVVCFIKLPSFYEIKTPSGPYNPDFGMVLKKKTIRDSKSDEYYFVIETKGTSDMNDRKALTENEIYKMKCAVKHFEALGIEAKINYYAPVKEYAAFKTRSEDAIHG